MGGMPEDLDNDGVLQRFARWTGPPTLLLIIGGMEVVAEAMVSKPGSDGGLPGWDLFTSVAGLPAARRILDPGPDRRVPAGPRPARGRVI
jgi:hypothetical protein